MQAGVLRLRLVVEGLELPVVSASVTSTANQPSSASVQIPMLPEALEFRERTLVHIFFLQPETTDSRPGDEWKTLFVGEIIGFAMTKTPLQRALVLQCADMSSYWDSTTLFNATGMGKAGKRLASFAGANTSVLSGGSANIFTGSSSTGFDRLVKLFDKAPASYPRMKGLLAGIVRVLEQIGGFYHGQTVFKGFNDFTSLAELRLKLTQQILAADGDTTSALIFKRKGLRKWMKNRVGARGSMSSFNQIIGSMLQLIFHSRQSIPCPPYQCGSATTKTVKYWAAGDRQVQKIRAALSADVRRFKRIKNLDRQAVNKVKHRIDYYDQQCGRASMTVKKSAAVLHHASATLSQAGAALPDGWPSSGFCAVKATGGKVAVAMMPAGQYYQTEVAARAASVRGCQQTQERYAAAMRLADKAVRILWRGNRRQMSKTVVDSVYERLGVHVFKPDIFFTTPPCCNVIFPEFHQQIQWGRNFLSEPTRLMLQGGSGRSGNIFGGGYSKLGVYFAPDCPSMRNDIKLSSVKFARSIMDHELFAGIIPARAQIPWAKVYRVDTRDKAKKFTYIQRLANFEYARQHYASRNGTVVGVFNPYFIPGFPALIVDRVLADHQLTAYRQAVGTEALGLADDQVKDRRDRLRKAVASQYLAYVTQLTHSLSQTGGTTSYNLSMVRTHREDSTKLGLDTVERYTKYNHKTRTSSVLVYSGDVDKYKQGPFGGRVCRVRAREQGPVVGRRYWRPRHTAGEVKNKWVLLPYEDLAEARGKEVFRLTEILSTTSKKIVNDLGIEYVLTPPWLAQVWHPAVVGKTYRQMFGVGSIIDDVGVSTDDMDEAIRDDYLVGGTVDGRLPPRADTVKAKTGPVSK